MTKQEPSSFDRWYEWTQRVDPTPSGPHGWIQWKGTSVCMDVTCACGEQHHVDADFAYNLKLPCGRTVMVSQHVRLFEVPADVPLDEIPVQVVEG